jgi:hypothetical protein
MGHSMRIYIFGILVAVLGLLAAGQVQADERCGLRSSSVLKVESWVSEWNEASKAAIYAVILVSRDDKEIKHVGGSLELFAKDTRIALVPLVLEHPVKPGARFELTLTQTEDIGEGGVIGDNDAGITALACISNISYADGSGVIIN